MNKTIDLTPIVGSPVLCEFWNVEGECSVGFLSYIQDHPAINAPSGNIPAKTLFSDGRDVFCYCRIYHHPDYWISNADGKLVLPEGLKLNVIDHSRAKIAEQHTSATLLSQWWHHTDIIAVQVTGVADGYQWGA